MQLFERSPGSRRKYALLLGIVVLAALAGCSSGGEDLPDEGALLADTSAAMEAVEDVQISMDADVTMSSNNLDQEMSMQIDMAIDRAAREMRMNQSIELGPQAINSTAYLVDGTMYMRNDAFTQQYSSEWIKIDLSENMTERWRQNDEFGNLAVMLENSTMTVRGTETVDGQEAYVLEGDVNESALEQYQFGNSENVEYGDISMTTWISTETNRPLKASGTMEMSVTQQGQSINMTMDYDQTYEYNSVDVTLPEGASNAAEVDIDLDSMFPM